MALDFPSPATPGQTYVNGGVWIYDGVKWNGAGGGGAYLPLSGGNESGRVNFAPGPAADIVLWQASPPGSTSVYLQLYNNGNSHISAQGGQLYLDCSNNVWISGSANGKGLVIQNTGGQYLHIWSDGAPHFGSSGGAALWLDAPTNVSGFLNCTDFYSSGNVNTAGIYYIQSRATLLGDTSYTTIRSPYNNAALLLGAPNVDPTNFYRNNVHRFTAWDDSFWAQVQVGALLSQTGRVISQNANQSPSFCCHWPGGYAAGMFLSNTNLYFGGMGGDGVYNGVPYGYFESNAHFNLFNGLNVTGSIAATGNVNGVALVASDALYCGGMYWHNDGSFMHTPWAIRTDNYIRLNGLDISNNAGHLYAANLWSANDVICVGVLRYQPAGSPYKGGRIECWGGDWDNVCFAMSGANFMFSPDRGGSGYYVSPAPFSDARLKSYIRDTDVDALAAIVSTPVRAFSWNEEGIRLQPHITNPHVSIGFVAQEVEKTMPTAVQPSPFDGDTLHLVDHNMTPYLVRAIQQLAARIEQLEAAR